MGNFPRSNRSKRRSDVPSLRRILTLLNVSIITHSAPSDVVASATFVGLPDKWTPSRPCDDDGLRKEHINICQEGLVSRHPGSEPFLSRRRSVRTAFKSADSDDAIDHEAAPRPLPPFLLAEKLRSYASSIRRLRTVEFDQDGHHKAKRASLSRAALAPARSLAGALRGEADELRLLSSETGGGVGGGVGDSSPAAMDSSSAFLFSFPNAESQHPLEDLREALSRATVQAIRAAADGGDYALVGRIVDAAVEYATVFAERDADTADGGADGDGATRPHAALLEPRLFGEALDALRRARASPSRIKKMWSLCASVSEASPSVLSSPPSAFELNAALLGLAERGRVRAALDLYRARGSGMRGDAYTASALFGMLADSIPDPSVLSIQEKPADDEDIPLDDEQDGEDDHLTSSLSSSPCWQWREVLTLLDEFEGGGDVDCDGNRDSMLNNRAYAAALKANERASALFHGGSRGRGRDRLGAPARRRKHFGAREAMGVLERMKSRGLNPDAVTCGMAMAAFDRGRQWRAALKLLEAMENSAAGSGVALDDDSGADEDAAVGESWSLPAPNAYSYAAAISACARCGEGAEALAVLDRLRAGDGEASSGVEPNTWIYNSALAACVDDRSALRSSSGVSKATMRHGRIGAALELLDRMEEDADVRRMDTAPDTVSYNTALAAVDGLFGPMSVDEDGTILCDSIGGGGGEGSAPTLSTASEEAVVRELLARMKTRDIPRDSTTYRNAILACRLCPDATLRMLETALADDLSDSSESRSRWRGGSAASTKLSRRGGRHHASSEGPIFLANTALSIFASVGDVEFVSKALSVMAKHGIKANAASAKHMIRAFSRSGDCNSTLVALYALSGDTDSSKIVVDRYDINIMDSGIPVPLVDEPLYSAAITSCISRHDLPSALHAFTLMKQRGLSPSRATVEEIIFEYCRLAMSLAGHEFKVARKERQLHHVESPLLRPRHGASSRRARAALEMTHLLGDPSPRLLSAVTKACAAAGLWVEGQKVLHSLQLSAVREARKSPGSGTPALEELPGLHRQLMKFCARSGNVTAAIHFADLIQDLSNKLSSLPKPIPERSRTLSVSAYLSRVLDQKDPSLTQEAFAGAEAAADDIATQCSSSVSAYNIGMKGEDWKLLMIAASKSGHWKLCLGTLPFLRPFVQETHPRHTYGTGNSIASLDQQYERLARALTAAVLCFEMRSQYGWSVRAIDDWIEWSGRRPRKEAVFSTCRILAARGRAQEVNNLISQVMRIPASKMSDEDEDMYPYERAIYTEAITALHRNGFYDHADELYAEAVAAGHLPWAVVDSGDEILSQLKLDLHGMTLAIAHSAVRVALQREIQGASWNEQSKLRLELTEDNPWDRDVLIVTGKGKRSEQHMRPILRPEVQRMLLEEFYPPMNTVSVPRNIGALRIPAESVEAWMQYQREQKGVRLLAVASALKNLSAGSRLKSLLKRRPKGVAKAITEAAAKGGKKAGGHSAGE